MRTLKNAYALIIGVDNAQKTTQVIRDAQAIYDVLTNQEICGYQEENITLLLDKEATTESINKAIDDYIAKIDENSSFLLFYSGHGGYHKGRSYLLPYGATSESLILGENLREKLSRMKSKRMIIMFDCCHSAGFFDGKDDIISQTVSNNSAQRSLNKTESLEGIAQEIDDEQGMAIIASSQAEELSWGDNNDDYSVLTTAFIEALNAKHKHFFADEYIRMVETVNYVFVRIPELIKILKQRSDIVKDQTPYANLQMNSDFVISYIPQQFNEKIVTNKFKIPVQQDELISAKSNDIESWERNEGNNLLLFLHGFSGESKDTFGNIPKMLQSDSNFDGWAMKPLGYTPVVQPKLGKDIWGAILDVDKIAGFLKTSIKYKFKDYDRIAIVAHSLGGLVAQKAILNQGFTDDYSMAFANTPNSGVTRHLSESIHTVG